MELIDTVSLIIYFVVFALQAIPLACQGLNADASKSLDSIVGGTTYMDKYYGNITFVLAAAAISCLLYLYLGITKLIGKSAGALVDSIILKSAIILQFAIATVEAVMIKNNSTAYTQLENALALANASNVSSPTVDAYNKFKNSHNLSLATIVLIYIVGFAGTFFVQIWQDKVSQEEKGQDKVKVADSSSIAQVNV